MRSLRNACDALQNVIVNVRQFVAFFEDLVNQVKILDRDLERLGNVIDDNEEEGDFIDAGEIREVSYPLP
jgi:hypothetical protein